MSPDEAAREDTEMPETHGIRGSRFTSTVPGSVLACTPVPACITDTPVIGFHIQNGNWLWTSGNLDIWERQRHGMQASAKMAATQRRRGGDYIVVMGEGRARNADMARTCKRLTQKSETTLGRASKYCLTEMATNVGGMDGGGKVGWQRRTGSGKAGDG